MSVSLLSRNVARKLSVHSVSGCDSKWICCLASKTLLGHLPWCGGLAVVLPNVLFMILPASSGAYTCQRQCGFVLALGEVCKVLLTLPLLVMALAV